MEQRLTAAVGCKEQRSPHTPTLTPTNELCHMTWWLDSPSDSCSELFPFLSLCRSGCTHQVAGVRSVTLPESLLFVSTLDGSLHAVSKQSGDIKWTLKEGAYTTSTVSHVSFSRYFLINWFFDFFQTPLFKPPSTSESK